MKKKKSSKVKDDLSKAPRSSHVYPNSVDSEIFLRISKITKIATALLSNFLQRYNSRDIAFVLGGIKAQTLQFYKLPKANK